MKDFNSLVENLNTPEFLHESFLNTPENPHGGLAAKSSLLTP